MMSKLTHAQAREMIGSLMQANAMRNGKCKRIKILDVTKKTIDGKSVPGFVAQDEKGGRKTFIGYDTLQKNWSHVVG